MSGLAKAFVVINLVLALFFLGAVTTLFEQDKGWKQAAETLGTELESIKESTKSAVEERDSEISRLEGNNSSLTTDKELLKQQNQELGNENGDLKTRLANAESRINVLDNSLAQRDQQISDKDNVIAQKDEALRTLDDLKAEAEERAKNAVAQMQRAVLDRQQMEEALGVAQSELVDANATIKDNEVTLAMIEGAGINIGDIVVGAQPRIEGVVYAVKDGMVVLSVGSDEQVREGYTFTVYDRDRFVGKVKVETVMNDMCGARVLFTEPGETIEAGQKASTRL